MSSAEIYIRFDELTRIPELNRQNYLFELEFLAKTLPKMSSVLQVGSMDGVRILRLLELRPDLVFTGLDIASDLVDLAKKNARDAGQSIRFMVGDITQPPAALEKYDYVVCLNNTLGFISDRDMALHHMRNLGKTYISVYGENFTNALAQEYFTKMGIEIEAIFED